MPELPGDFGIRSGQRQVSVAIFAVHRRSCLTRKSKMRSPESLLPMKISETQVRDRSRQWYGNRWFAPNALKKRGAHRHGEGRLYPVLDLRRAGHADWTAESGYYYYDTESYTEIRMASGKTRQVQQTRWEPSAAASTISSTTNWCPHRAACIRKCCGSIEPFPTKELSGLPRRLFVRLDRGAVPNRSHRRGEGGPS